MDYDLRSNLLVSVGAVQAVLAVDTILGSIDTQSSTNVLWKGLTAEIHIGAGGITFSGTNKIDFIVEHSDDNSVWSAVSADDVILDYTSALTYPDATGIVKSLQAAHATPENFLVGIRSKKRYVRVRADFSGTHGTGTALGLNWILSHPTQRPAWQTSVPDMV